MMRANPVRPVVYILGLAAFSCAWTAASSSIAYWSVFGIAALASTRRGLDEVLPLRFGRPWPRPSLRSIALGVLAATPPLVVLVRTLGQEFPFVGDHDHHLFQTEWSWRFLRWAIVPLVAGIALLVWKPQRSIAIGFLVALFAASHLPLESTVFATRYPGLDQVTILPLNALSHLAGCPSPTNVMRIEHALVVPSWLFVLRPLLLGRRPDAWALVAALGFVWPGMAAYHFTASYLEPPMLVFVALAVEASLREGAPGRRAALLYLGVASLFKEQALFAIPPIAAVGIALDADSKERRETLRIGFIACVPVVLYFITRRHVAVWRGAGLLPLGRILDAGRIAQWATGAWRAFGPTGLLLAAAAIAAFARIVRRAQWTFAAWSVVVAIEIAFFYSDSFSEPWTGYARFLLVPATVAGCLFAELASSFRPTVRAGAAAALAASTMPTLVPLLARTAADTQRNFYEHTDAPIFLPVEHGVALLPPDTRRVRVVSTIGLVLPQYSIYALDAAYPGLARRMSFEIPQPGHFAEDDCACAAGDPPRLVLFLVFANRSEADPRRPSIEAAQARCRARLEATCTTTRVIEGHGASLWGMVAFR